MPTSDELKTKRALFERIGWDVAERDDRAVAAAVAAREEIDIVHNLDQAGLLDAFMAYLREIGFLAFLESFTPSLRERFMIPSCFVLLTYMVKTLLGIDAVYAMPALLFTDPAMMRVIGFNARWIEEGLCRRSHEKRGEDKEPPKPFCAQMVANFLADLTIQESAAFFNRAIQCLARFGVFPASVTLVLDGTDIETTQKCTGAGRVVRTEEKKDRRGRIKKVEVVLFGFKAIAAYDLTTQLPVAVIVTKIHRHETLCTRRLIQQAQANLAPGGSKIGKVLVDRGFLDGKTMYWLDEQGIAFVVPAKTNMQVYHMARNQAEKGHGYVQTRTRNVTHGHGKERRVETLATEVIGVEDLAFWDTYNDPDARKKIGRRGYRPKPIHAVVVRTWDNQEFGPGGKVVFLTNQPVTHPLSVFDDYDGRSLIENTLFREGKQGWSLESIPQKNQRAAVAHIYITFAMVALTTAYREWMRQEEEEEANSTPSLAKRLGHVDDDEFHGVRRWRRDLKKAVKDYVIVFLGDHYGIFHVAEFTILAGYRIRRLPEELGTREDIFARYGLTPPTP